MEGLLARWALAIQEYDFTITYRKGQDNGNAEALSRKTHTAATTQVQLGTDELRQQQLSDSVIQQIHAALSQTNSGSPQTSMWRKRPYSRYKQIWSQLCVHDELVCRRYTTSPCLNTVLVPLIPESYHPTVLYQNHNAVTAAHLGIEKTTARVH